MSFNPGIPNASDLLLQSQSQIRANYQAINQVFNANHSILTSNSNTMGMHSVLTMRPQSMDPSTDSTHVAFYNKLVSSVPELFFRPNSNQTPIQLTYPSISTMGSETLSGIPPISITGITTGATTTINVTSTSGLNTGQQVTFTSIVGTKELNGKTATITVLNGTQFTVPIATTNNWVSGGNVYSLLQYSFVAGPFVVYGGLIKKATQGQTITLAPTSTLLYVGLTGANRSNAGLFVGSSCPTSISGSSFNISYANNFVGTLDVYYLAIGQ